MSLPYGLIEKCDKYGGQSGRTSNYGLSFELYSPLSFKISLSKDNSQRKIIHQIIQSKMEVGTSVRQSIQGQLHGNAPESPGYTIYDPFKEAYRLGIKVIFQPINYATQQYEVHNCKVKFPYINDHNTKLNYFPAHQNLYVRNKNIIDGAGDKKGSSMLVPSVSEFDVLSIQLMDRYRQETQKSLGPMTDNGKKKNMLQPSKNAEASEHSQSINSISEEIKENMMSHIALTNYNYSFQLCETYHPLLMFPSFIDRTDLLYMAQFRSNRRLVICCWTKAGKPVLARCAQPMQGGQKQADQYDKISFTALCTEKYPKIILFDARPPFNAKANQLIGKGVEKVSQYECIDRLVYLNLQNIHVVRDAFNTLKNQIIEYQQKVIFGQNGIYNNFGILENIKQIKQDEDVITDEQLSLQDQKTPFLFTHSDLFVIKLQKSEIDLGLNIMNLNMESSDLKEINGEDDFKTLDYSLSGSKCNDISITEKTTTSGFLNIKQRKSLVANSFMRNQESIDMSHLLDCGQGNTVVITDAYPQKLQSAITSYLQLKKQLLTGAYLIANAMFNGFNCVIHCSDGWDRTPQLSALTQLFVDPYYRTVNGFAVLIQKEFMAFGHRFGTRTGSIPKPDAKETSPVFHLFLEATAEIVNQNQEKFEFTEDFLIYLAFSIKSRQFGDFMFDCEAERLVNEVHKLTNSVFDSIDEYKVWEISLDDRVENQLIFDLNKVNLWESWWWQHSQ